MTVYKNGEIVLIEFPQFNDKQTKKRPALVILDIGDDDIVLAPITTIQRSGPGDAVIHAWKDSGLLKESWVRLAKIACLSKNSIIKKLGKLHTKDQKFIFDVWERLYQFI